MIIDSRAREASRKGQCMKDNMKIVEEMHAGLSGSEMWEHYHCVDCGVTGTDVNAVGVVYASFRVDEEGVIEFVLCPLCGAKRWDKVESALMGVLNDKK